MLTHKQFNRNLSTCFRGHSQIENSVLNVDPTSRSWDIFKSDVIYFFVKKH